MLGLLGAAALALRLFPYSETSMPFNADGLAEARMATDIARAGALGSDPGASYAASYVADLPVLNILLASVALTAGGSTYEVATALTATLGGLAVTLVGLGAWRASGRVGPGLLAAALLALLGSFVYATTSVWKEALGLAMIAAWLWLGLEAQRRTCIGLRALLLLLLVFTHHHTAVLGLLMASYETLLRAFGAARSGQQVRAILPQMIGPAAGWAVLGAYYPSIDLQYVDFLTPETGFYLFLAIATLFGLLALVLEARAGEARPIRQPSLFWLVPLVGVALLLANAFIPIFPGTILTPLLLLGIALVYLVLVPFVAEGLRLLFAAAGSSRPVLLGGLFGPLAMLTFGLLRGLDLVSYTIVVRTFDFLLPAGIIVAAIGWAALRLAPRGRAAIGGALAAAALLTLPIATDTPTLFGVQNMAFQYEVDGLGWLKAHGTGAALSSDQRLHDFASHLYDLSGDPALPYALRGEANLTEDAVYVLEVRWTTQGGQEFPFGFFPIDPSAFEEFTSESALVYRGGPVGDSLLLVIGR